MERGISGSKARLEAIQFKIKKEEEYLKVLEERKSEIKKEVSHEKFEELIIKEPDFLGFQRMKIEKTLMNMEKIFKAQKSQLLKNKTELETKTKQIAELSTKNGSLKKEVQFYKSKNTTLLTNESVFAVEKKKYLDSVMNTIKKSILHESIRIPNIYRLNNIELKEKMIRIIEKTAKENQIPNSALEEVLKNREENTKLFELLRGGMNNGRSEDVEITKRTVKKKL